MRNETKRDIPEAIANLLQAAFDHKLIDVVDAYALANNLAEDWDTLVLEILGFLRDSDPSEETISEIQSAVSEFNEWVSKP